MQTASACLPSVVLDENNSEHSAQNITFVLRIQNSGIFRSKSVQTFCVLLFWCFLNAQQHTDVRSVCCDKIKDFLPAPAAMV